MVSLALADDPVGVPGTLLAACQAGDRAARERLFADCAPRVFRWAVLLGLPAPDAEDAAQEVLATAARRLERCEAQAALGTWLFQITRRVVANARRSAWVRHVLHRDREEPAAPAFEHESRASVDDELSVRRCFGRLSPRLAEVLLLCEVEGHTRAEVARLLEVAEGTVASRLRLAREAFRKLWEADAPPEGALR